MLEIIITSSLLILIVMAIRFALRGRLSPAVIYALWALVAVRLLLPVSIAETSISVMNLFERPESVQTEQAEDVAPMQNIQQDTQQPAEMPQSSTSGEAVQVLPEDSSESTGIIPESTAPVWKITAESILTAVWLTGTAAVMLYTVVSNVRFYIFLRKNRRLYDDIRYPVPVYIADGIDSPCLFGVVRPAIYLNEFAAEDKQRVNYIITHELTHCRHLDHIWSVVRVVCCALYWFNPLVWLAAHLSRQDCELACDSAVVRKIGEDERYNYGRTLIDMINTRFQLSSAMLTSTSMTADAKAIKRRIQMLRITPKNILWAAAVTVVILAAAVGCTFTGANTPQSDAETDEQQFHSQETEETLMMQDFPYILGTPFSSSYEGDYLARSHNLELAARLIDGTVIQPGEEFSFNQTVGERTEERGFVEAKLYPGEADAEQFGGGIAQTAGTLFNAAFLADLEITQHFTHLYTVSYFGLKYGIDASVTWGSQDLCFVNNREYPIMIRMVYENNTLIASIHGDGDESNVRIEMGFAETETVRYNVVFRPGKPDSINIPGQIGKTVKVYKLRFVDGVEVERTLEYTATYLPQNQVIYTDELPEGYEYYTEYSEEAREAYDTMEFENHNYPESNVQKPVTGLSGMKAEDIWSIPELQYLLADIPVFESGKVDDCYHYVKGVANDQEDVMLGYMEVPQMDMIIMRIQGISPQIVENHIEKLKEAGFVYEAPTYDNYFYNAPAYGIGVFYEFHGLSEVQITIFQQGDDALGNDPVPKG